MPKLEASIEQWKATMTAAFGGATEIVDELEGHLREEIDHQILGGKSPAAAFELAQAGLGTPARLAAEYARAVPPARWLPVYVVGILPASLCALAAWGLIFATSRHPGPLLVAHLIALVAGYAIAFYAGMLGFCYVVSWLFRPLGLGQQRLLGRVLIGANAAAALLLLAGMALGSVWAKEHMGAFWNNDPREFGTLIPLLWLAAMSLAGRLLPQRQHAWVLLSIVGVGLSLGGWLGPALLHSREVNRINSPELIGIAATATLLPLAVACLGLLPPGQLRRRAA